MNLIQESQSTLEKVVKECQETVHARKMICKDVDANIKLLQDQKKSKLDRLTFYKQVIDSGKDKDVNQRESNVSSLRKQVKKDDASKLSGDGTVGVSSSMSIGNTKKKENAYFVFNQYLAKHGATREEIKRINEVINELVAKAQIK